jgi:hypothetical protein
VKPNAAGGWDVLKDGDRRAAVTAETRSAAIRQARELVLHEGGGEIRIIDRTGKIESSQAVRAKEPRAAAAAAAAAAER